LCGVALFSRGTQVIGNADQQGVQILLKSTALNLAALPDCFNTVEGVIKV